MSIHVMNRVWMESPAKGSELLIMLAIADFATDEGVAWPGVETLANKARLSKRQTQYNIRSLVDAGLLTVEENAGPHGVHRYRVMGCNVSTRAKSAPVQNPTQGGAKSDTKGVQPIAPKPSIEPSEEPSLINPHETSFDQFWDVWPKKVDKDDAHTIWIRMKPTPALVDTIVHAVQEQTANNWLDTPKQFIPGPAKWLRGKKWTDEIIEPPPPATARASPNGKGSGRNDGYTSAELLSMGRKDTR